MSVADQEANYFAICLLMPEEFVRREIEKIPSGLDVSDDRQMTTLAGKFNVSIGLMAIRLSQLGYLR